MAGCEWNTIQVAVALVGPHHMQKCGPHQCFNMGANSDTAAVGKLGVRKPCEAGGMARHASGILNKRTAKGVNGHPSGILIQRTAKCVNGQLPQYSHGAVARHHTSYCQTSILQPCNLRRHQACCCSSMSSESANSISGGRSRYWLQLEMP